MPRNMDWKMLILMLLEKVQIPKFKCQFKSKNQRSNPLNPPLLKGGEERLLIYLNFGIHLILFINNSFYKKVSFRLRIKYGVNSSRNPVFPVETGTQFLDGSRLSSGHRLDAPVSSTGQAPRVRHDGSMDFMDRH